MFDQLFAHSLAHKLRALDVDPRIVDAMIAVGRSTYVDKKRRMSAFVDSAMSIGHGQTISQPTFLAQVIDAAHIAPGDRVLEIGTGSGYAAAVLGLLAKDVVTVERIEELAVAARARLARDGAGNVRVVVGDGFRADGVASVDGSAARYDAILVMAGAPAIPDPAVALLAPGGRLVVPVGPLVDGGVHARLLRVTVAGDGERRVDDICGCSWVPFVGADGFATPTPQR